MVAIRIENVSVTYPSQISPATHATTCRTIQAVQDVSFTVEQGTFVALVGQSGCGKTTLLRAVAGLIQPTHGTIMIGDDTALQARHKRLLSLMFQRAVLLPWKTAVQNVALPLRLAGWNRHTSHETAYHYLAMVGLDGYANMYPHQLSGGMQQRVALARTLCFSPAVLLLDEPFSALDELTRERLNGELLRIWSTSQATVLFVTHSLSEAVFLADRVLVIAGSPGTIVDDVAIMLPRPRISTLLDSPALMHYVAQLRAILAK